MAGPYALAGRDRPDGDVVGLLSMIIEGFSESDVLTWSKVPVGPDSLPRGRTYIYTHHFCMGCMAGPYALHVVRRDRPKRRGCGVVGPGCRRRRSYRCMDSGLCAR